MTVLTIMDIKTSYIFQPVTVATQLSTTKGEVSVLIQQINDIGGKQNQNA